VVHVGRFSEDGSRKITRIAEARGLDENNYYRLVDIFVSRFRGRTAEGRIISELEATGEKPTFAREPHEQGMSSQIRLTDAIWTPGEQAV